MFAVMNSYASDMCINVTDASTVMSYSDKPQYLGCVTKWQISQPPELTPSWHTYMKAGGTFYSTEIRVLLFNLVT